MVVGGGHSGRSYWVLGFGLVLVGSGVLYVSLVVNIPGIVLMISGMHVAGVDITTTHPREPRPHS